MRQPFRVLAYSVLAISIVIPMGGLSAQTPAKKPLSYEAYDGWKSIQGTRVSRDGAWLAYALAPQDGDGELVVRNLQTGTETRHPRGRDPQVTFDDRFVVFTIAPPKADVDKAKKDKKKPEEMPKNGLGILTLATGELYTAARVKSVALPEEAGGHVAYLLEKPEKKDEKKPEAEPKKEAEPAKEETKAGAKKEKKKDPGTELVVRDLAAGTHASIAEVVEYAWAKNGAWLAYTVSSDAKTPEKDGAFARRVATGDTRALLTGLGHYKGLAFDDNGAQVAFLSDRDTYKDDPATFRLYHWASAGTTGAAEVAARGAAGVPEGMAPSEHGKPEFSKDGARLYFGYGRIPDPATPEDAPEPVKVDIWNWKDPELQPMQKVRADDEKKRQYRAVVHLKERKVVALAAPDLPTAVLSDAATTVLGSSNVPYRQLISWDMGYNDYVIVNQTDGSRRTVVEKSPFNATLSPGGQFAVWFDAGLHAWLSFRVADGRISNLTGALGVRFENETWDTPDLPAPYGIAGWTDGDRSILLYDRYDIWEVRPDGTAPHMITKGVGRTQQIVFRYQRTDPDAKTIDPTKPVLLRAVDSRSKASGFYRTTFATGEPTPVLMLDKQVMLVTKAKQADRFVLTAQRFDEFPDLWVADGSLADPTKVSTANPQQAEYNWGRSELIDYRNADGKMLRAILTKPENFDPARKYPLLVYIYEELTDGLHRYVAPAPGTSINVTRYVSNGYVVLQPDIEYQVGYPGESALKCVLPAVQKVLDQGYIDPARVGIQGHSWGGYQITHLITRTNIFRAVQAGASVSNMVSAYGGIRWGSGMSRAFQYERTQSRIGGPPWAKELEFFENSPIFWVEKVQTPYLSIHNDDDDAVPWYQGIEFFSALRRLGKEAYMFNYNGEKHGLRERENQKHWTVHQDEFFDHFLLNRARPSWMDQGVPYLDRGKRDVREMYKRQ